MENKFTKFLKWFFHSYIWVGILLLILDIISKNIVCNLMHEGDSIELIPNFLSITYTVNRGAAFGIGTDNLLLNRILYIIVALASTGFIIFFFIKKNKTLPGYVKAALMIIAAGALGNLLDRVYFTSEYIHAYPGTQPGVVDFIDFFKGSELHNLWHYIFNVADCGVVIGVFMLIAWVIIDDIKESKNKKNSKPTQKEDNTKVLSKSELEKLEEIDRKKAK